MQATLSQHLTGASVDMATLQHRYRPLLALVNELIGVVPNCDTFLEIWPPGFRSYNLLVPSFFNLPAGLCGLGLSQRLLGLALYSASQAAACPYCTAHTCAYALRRGSSEEQLLTPRGVREKAVAEAAKAAASVPSELGQSHLAAVDEHLSQSEGHWLALGVSAMGFLNKFMDSSGVQLEEESLAMVGPLLAARGWKPGKSSDWVPPSDNVPGARIRRDSIATLGRVLRHAPGAIRLELGWTLGVPSRWPRTGDYLRDRTGYHFPVLKTLKHRRPTRALVTVLKDNLDPALTQIGLRAKSLTGLVFATVVGSDALTSTAKALGTHNCSELCGTTFEQVQQFSRQPLAHNAVQREKQLQHLASLPGVALADAHALLLARAAAPSPSEVNDSLASDCIEALGAAGVVELLVWLSINQLLYRLESFARADKH